MIIFCARMFLGQIKSARNSFLRNFCNISLLSSSSSSPLVYFPSSINIHSFTAIQQFSNYVPTGPDRDNNTLLAEEVEFGELIFNIRRDFEESIAHDLVKIEVEEREIRLSSPEAEEEMLYYDSEAVEVDLEAEAEWQEWEQEDEMIMGDLQEKRGEFGVFDVWELTLLLKEERCEDVCVIKIPEEYQYTDYFIITTVTSSRHMNALLMRINKLYKMKREPGDPYIFPGGGREGPRGPKRKGYGGRRKGHDAWISLDMSNIVLHMFMREAREYYDLESLWCMGDREGKVHEENIVGEETENVLSQYEDIISEELREKLGLFQDKT